MLTLALLLLTAAPTAHRATTLAAARAWDELYLAFASARPASYPSAARVEIARRLHQGCRALTAQDAALAFSLAERAVAFSPSPDAVLCFVNAALATDQRGAARGPLEAAHRRAPTDTRLTLLLARFYLDEQEPQRALEILTHLPRSKSTPETRALLARARQERTDEAAALAQARRVEASLRAGKGSGAASPSVGALSYESGVDESGRRTRSNARFRFKYFNRERDFGQRADYEGRVAAALEEAVQTTRAFLGAARERAVDVVLYSREEFRAHHSEGLSQVVAGFYGAGAIHINDAAAIDAENTATLVHEYVHAFLDDHTAGRGGALPRWLNEGTAQLVEWRYRGWDPPPRVVTGPVKRAAVAGRLPSLQEMTSRALISQADPRLSYAFSALAVRALLQRGGPPSLLAFTRDLGRGQDFSRAFETRYGRTLEKFEEELRAELRHP